MTQSSPLAQYESADAIERWMGDPNDASCVLGLKRSMELDELEQYPEQACREIDRWGLRDHYVPREYGGSFGTIEELFALIRAVARRDVTVAIAHVMSYVASIAVWMRGSDEQKRRLAEMFKSGASVAIALTEKEHGADVLANEVAATPAPGGYTLSGEKWLISNATRCEAVTLFARTDTAGGPRGFSLFFVEKSQLHPSTFTVLPRIKTHGVRGADIAGFRFDGCYVPDSALLGPRGAGLELTLKAFQISRTVLPAAVVGAADAALRSAMRLALSRKLYSANMFSIPEVQGVLADVYTRLLMCECVAVAAARGLHVATGQMSIWSAVSKYFVPDQIDGVIRDLAVIMGARHYLREGHDWGVFQKLLREGAALGSFHLGSYLNLSLIGQQMRSLANARNSSRVDPGAVEESLEAVFSLERPLPDLDTGRLQILNRGRDDLTQGLEICRLKLADLLTSRRVEPEMAEELIGFVDDLTSELRGQEQRLAAVEHRYGNAFNQSPELFALARRFCTVHAAACCVWTWLYNRDSFGEFFSRGEWLASGLAALLRTLREPRDAMASARSGRIAESLIELHRTGQPFSIRSLKPA